MTTTINKTKIQVIIPRQTIIIILIIILIIIRIIVKIIITIGGTTVIITKLIGLTEETGITEIATTDPT